MISRLLPAERRRHRLGWLLALFLAALTALTVRASVTDTDPYGQNAVPADRTAVMTRATALAAQVMSYRAATAADDIAAAKDQMTEQMRDDYDQTLPPAAGRQEQAKAGVRVDARVARLDGGDVRKPCPKAACAVGITSLTGDKATVLLFVNQYATAKTTKNTLVNPTWEIVRLVRRHGTWLIDHMETP